MPRISLIIPAYNEESCLPALLDSVNVARQRYEAGADQVEVIVADNSSTDHTAQIARARGCLVTEVQKRTIGAARNGGARLAKGEILAFIDADSTIHPDTFNIIDRTMVSGRYVAGGTGAWFSRMSPGIFATMALGMILMVLANLEIGVIFCRRADFEEIGGYSEQLLCAEDVELLVGLKKLGRPRRERFARPRGARAITSARKFDRHGDWHYFTLGPVTGLYSLLFDRPALERQIGRDTIQEYWYDDRQPGAVSTLKTGSA